jgi:hypothetical protein
LFSMLFLIRFHDWFMCWNTSFRCLIYARGFWLLRWCLIFYWIPLRLFDVSD